MSWNILFMPAMSNYFLIYLLSMFISLNTFASLAGLNTANLALLSCFSTFFLQFTPKSSANYMGPARYTLNFWFGFGKTLLLNLRRLFSC
jgi:hypothetical protein